jgi:hypothetical protein
VTTRTLPPHNPYIDAAVTALEEVGLDPADSDARDSEACINYLMLDAVITLTPEASGIPADRFEHGLMLIWEHHDNHGEDCLDEGASWQWARLNEDGSNWVPEPLPVPGFVAPEMLAATVATLVHTGKPTPMGSLWHEHLRKPVEAAIEAWGAES